MNIDVRDYYKYIRPFKKHIIDFYMQKYGNKAMELWRKTLAKYNEFVLDAPYIGGSKSIMAHNLYQCLTLFAIYEVTDHTITNDEMQKFLDVAFLEKLRKVGKFVSVKHLDKGPVRNFIYKWIYILQKQAIEHRGKDWNNTWGIRVNPKGHKNGISIHLVGCPIVDFAKRHGYEHLMPIMCNTDNVQTELLGGKLIRNDTVANGASECDYWILAKGEPEI